MVESTLVLVSKLLGTGGLQFRTSRHSLKFRILPTCNCGLLCVFWDVPNRNLFRLVSSEKEVKALIICRYSSVSSGLVVGFLDNK